MVASALPMYLLSWAFLVFWCCNAASILVATIAAALKLRRKPPKTGACPGVSVLKPLVGTDPNLAANLETFFAMDYPEFELIFCFQDANDPARQVRHKGISSAEGCVARGWFVSELREEKPSLGRQKKP
jgi:hypothetical protein